MPANSLLFGWCLKSMPAKQHKNCKKQFLFDAKTIVCECDCHKKEKK